jgi:FixJ family two-component response regulator
MPDGTGLWLLRQTQTRALQVPVVMMTGYADVYLTERLAR